MAYCTSVPVYKERERNASLESCNSNFEKRLKKTIFVNFLTIINLPKMKKVICLSGHNVYFCKRLRVGQGPPLCSPKKLPKVHFLNPTSTVSGIPPAVANEEENKNCLNKNPAYFTKFCPSAPSPGDKEGKMK